MDCEDIHESVTEFYPIVDEDFNRAVGYHHDLIEEKLCHQITILRSKGLHLHPFCKVVLPDNDIFVIFYGGDQRPHQVHTGTSKRYIGIGLSRRKFIALGQFFFFLQVTHLLI